MHVIRRTMHLFRVYRERMAKRLSLILGDGDQLALEPFVRPDTDQHRVLQRWAADHDFGAVNSEAAALRALLRAGVEALRDDVLDAGYAELAKDYASDEERTQRRAARDRYISRTEASV